MTPTFTREAAQALVDAFARLPREAFLREAEACAARHAGDPQVHTVLGSLFAQAGLFDRARDTLAAGLRLEPGNADAAMLLGATLQRLGDHAGAEAAFAKALAQVPDPEIMRLRAVSLDSLGRSEEAWRLLEQALALAPGHPGLRPMLADMTHNRGLAHERAGDDDAALAEYRRAAALAPGHAGALLRIGVLLDRANQPEAALEAIEAACAADPTAAGPRLQRLNLRARLCDWPVYESAAAEIAAIERLDDPLPPFALLNFEDSPERQLDWARRHAERALPMAGEVPPPPPAPDGRIRIGYFSADVHDHATMYLLGGVLREHDRSRFATHLYSYGTRREGASRAAAADAVEHFHDLGGSDDDAAVALARADRLDIAVDLKGFTAGGRPAWFARRLAPVQVNYLGYPGTCGAAFHDYLVADRTVLPESERAHVRERVLHMPHSYQPNDNLRAIAGTAPDRRAAGLPDDGVVFACFNHTWKITPREVALWSRLLHEVPGSVLWLLRSNAGAVRNLRRAFEGEGLAPGRLVFAAWLPHAEHLARLRLADIALDTFPCNAHTTASDALWAGVPVITRAGRSFAARVCASILHAAGLDRLIAGDDAQYLALARALASDPGARAALRRDWQAARMRVPLFDTAAYTRALERGWSEIHRRRLAGLSPVDITIGDLP